MTITEAWDYLTGTGVATEEELQLVTSLNGYTKRVLKDILFARTGYRTFKQHRNE